MLRLTPEMAVVMLAWPVAMIGVLLWFKSMTLDRLRFLERENLLPRDPQRTKALVSYLSAPLALVAAACDRAVRRGAVRQPRHVAAGDRAACDHALRSDAAGRGERMRICSGSSWTCRRGRRYSSGFCSAIWHAITGGFYCIALPAAFAMLAKNMLGG